MTLAMWAEYSGSHSGSVTPLLLLCFCLCCCRYNLRVRLYRPRSASLLQTFTSWLTGMPAEFSDPKFPSYGEGREGEQRLVAELLPPTQACTQAMCKWQAVLHAASKEGLAEQPAQ